MKHSDIDPLGSPSSLLVCAWCGRVMRHGDPPVAHGICPNCTELDEPVPAIALVAPEVFEGLPFGIIRLTGDGIVESYNGYEARHARRVPAQVIGRHFFREVAPCANVQAFAGRLEAMRMKGEPATERFGFVFRLPWTRCTVRLALTYEPAHDRAVVIVDWTPTAGQEV